MYIKCNLRFNTLIDVQLRRPVKCSKHQLEWIALGVGIKILLNLVGEVSY